MITSNKIINEDLDFILSENLDWNYFQGKTILVTGANGFIPSYIVLSFLAMNEKFRFKSSEQLKVVGVVRNLKKSREKFRNILTNPNLELVENDVVKPFEYENKIDIIVHAASQASPKFYAVDPVGTLKANTLGTMNFLEFAVKNNCEKFIFISSCDVYGIPSENQKVLEETNCGNVCITEFRSCYGESKRMGETMCVSYAKQFGLYVNMLRLAHTYGPGIPFDDGRVFADFAKNIVHNENIKIKSDGSAKRPFLYIADMVRAFFIILLNAPSGEAYNIAAENLTSIRELAEILCALYPEKNLHAEFGRQDNKNYVPSKACGTSISTKKLQSLGWKQMVSISQGFKRMIDSYVVQ